MGLRGCGVPGLGLGASAPRPFVPTALPGCALWLRGDLGLIPNGADLAAWTNQTGGVSPVQTDPTKQPAHSATGPNSTAAVAFDGVDEYLTGAAFSLAQPCHIFAIAKLSATPAVSQLCDAGTDNKRRIYSTAGGIFTYNGANLGVAKTPNAWRRIETFLNGVSSSIRVDDATASGNSGTGAASGLIIGARGGLSAYGDCTIAELIMYSGEVTGAGLAALRAYLLDRYGL